MNIKLLVFLALAVPWLAAGCGSAGSTPTPDVAPDSSAPVDLRIGTDIVPVFPDLADELTADLMPDYGSPDLCCDIVTPWQPQPCQSHQDCEDGFCIELEVGSGQFYCAPTCIEECPLDWVCKAVYLDGPDPVSVCLPPTHAPCLDLDLLFDGIDEDCDGETDEDILLGLTLVTGAWRTGGSLATAPDTKLQTDSGNTFSGLSAGGDFVLSAGIR